MKGLRDLIVAHVKAHPGQTDREITDAVVGKGKAQQGVNQASRELERRGLVVRDKRGDGKIGNFPATTENAARLPIAAPIPKRSEEPASRTIAMTADELATLRRTLFRLLDRLDPVRDPSVSENVAERIRRLSRAGVI